MPAVALRGAGRRAVCRAACAGLWLGSLAALVAGCARSTPQAVERLRYERHHALKTYGDCAHGDERCARITLRWPVVTGAPTAAARESIGAFVRSVLLTPYEGGAPLPSEDSVMAGFIDAYRSFVSAMPGGPAGWTFERRIEPLGDTLDVASLAVTVRSFTGGAHPNSETRFTNIDLRTGRMLRRADLFLEGSSVSLDSLGELAFRRVRRLGPSTDLAAEGYWFEAGRFRLNDNLAVTPTGLLWFFNDYEIGPHVLGATEISLPWAEIEALVRPDGPLGRGRPR